jgi:hypothetical protein
MALVTILPRQVAEGQTTTPGAGAVEKVQPYTAEFTITNLQTLANGTTITKQTRIVEARDSESRTLRETTEFPASSDQPARTVALVRDPVAGTNIIWQSWNHQAVLQKLPSREQRHGCWATDTGSLAASYDDIRSPNAAVQKSAVESPVVEDLGTTMIDGVEAHGYRKTTSTPAGAIGNDAPLVSTDEYWQAPSLGLTLRNENDDPKTGKQTRELVSLSLSEPDPAIFQAPEGYKVVTQEMHQVPCQELAR